MKSNNYLISIIIPTYNRCDNLVRTVKSVLQSKGNYEIIIVDDNGLDTSCQKENEKKLSKFLKLSNFKYIKHEKNLNGSAARNTGVNNSTGEYIAFLDDDDEFLSNRIALLENIIKTKKPDFIYSNVVVKNNGFVELVTDYKIKSLKEYQFDLLNFNSFFGTGSNIVCRRDLVKKINGFDTSYIRHQDYEFMLRYLDECNSIELISSPTIIKNNDDRQNVPNFEKNETIKLKYLFDFDYIVKRYSKDEQSIIKNKLYNDLLFQATIFKKKEYIKKYKNILKDNDGYSFLHLLKQLIRYKLRNTKLIKIIRNKLYKNKI